jgi:glutathione S-transferase
MTWADLHLFAAVDVMRQLAPTAAQVVAKYPRVEQLVARVEATPKVAEYLKKRGKWNEMNNNLASTIAVSLLN